MGAPPRSEVGCRRVEKSCSVDEVEGKTVERVAIEDKLSIRRASMADSWTVGIRYSGKKNGGLERRCRVGGVEAETRETMDRRRPVGSNIFVNGRKVYEKVNNREPKDSIVYIQAHHMDWGPHMISIE